MLAKWCEILPLFVVRYLAKKLCERVYYNDTEFCIARPDVLVKLHAMQRKNF